MATTSLRSRSKEESARGRVPKEMPRPNNHKIVTALVESKGAGSLGDSERQTRTREVPANLEDCGAQRCEYPSHHQLRRQLHLPYQLKNNNNKTNRHEEEGQQSTPPKPKHRFQDPDQPRHSSPNPAATTSRKSATPNRRKPQKQLSDKNLGSAQKRWGGGANVHPSLPESKVG